MTAGIPHGKFPCLRPLMAAIPLSTSTIKTFSVFFKNQQLNITVLIYCHSNLCTKLSEFPVSYPLKNAGGSENLVHIVIMLYREEKEGGNDMVK